MDSRCVWPAYRLVLFLLTGFAYPRSLSAVMKQTAQRALRAFVAQRLTQKDAASDLHISPQYLGDMLRGQRAITERVLRQLGLETVVSIRKVG